MLEWTDLPSDQTTEQTARQQDNEREAEHSTFSQREQESGKPKNLLFGRGIPVEAGKQDQQALGFRAEAP